MEDRLAARGDYNDDYVHDYERREGSAFRDVGQKRSTPDGKQAWVDMDTNCDDEITTYGEEILEHIGQLKNNIKQNFQEKRDVLKKLTEDKKFLEKQLKEVEKKYKEIERKQQLRHVHSHESELEKVKQRLQQKSNDYNELMKEAKDIINKLKEENIELKRRGAEKGKDLSLQQKVDEKNKAIQRLHAECEELKTRLSKMMGDKLHDGNPDIADLSDKNRPTKLGERFNELYDNQWTDALEVIQSKFPFTRDPDEREKKCISILLDILMSCKQFCDAEGRKQDIEITNVFFRTNMTPDHRQVRIPEEMTKQLKDFKKCIAPYSAEYVCEKYVKHPKAKTDITIYVHDIPDFVRECINICWLMVQHDPQLEFGPISHYGDEFNKKLYKEFTSSGTEVDFVVWPPLLLHANGPVIAKGVAQGIRSQSPVRKRPLETFQKKNKAYIHPKHTINVETYTIPEHQIQSKKDHKGPRYMKATVASRMKYQQAEDRYREHMKRTPTDRQYGKYLYYMNKYGSEIAKQILGINSFKMCTDYDKLCRY